MVVINAYFYSIMLGITQQSVYSPQEAMGFSSIRNRNRSLKGYLRKIYHVDRITDCFRKCLEENGLCRSFNFGETAETSIYLCELNSISVNSESKLLIKRIGFPYYPVVY